MWLLLKYQGYPTAVVVAFTIHGLLLYFIFGSSISSAEFIDIEKAVIVTASVVQENPQRLRRLEQIQTQQAREQRQREESAAREREQRQRQAREEQAAAEQRAQDERQQRELAEARDRAERQRLAQEAAEEEQARREQQQRDERLAQEQADREAEQARQAEAQRQAEQITAENQQIQSYTSAIHSAVGENWSRPPSARNGMTVLLEIKLVPTGEVVAVTVIESSGDFAVDRSAEQAVRKVARFYDLEGMPIGLFERSFRNFNLHFIVEDLLR